MVIGLMHQNHPANHRDLFEHLRQYIVIVRQSAEIGVVLEQFQLFQGFGEPGRGDAVEFGEDDIECDQGCAKIGQPSHEFGNIGARSWPLTAFLERNLINVDNQHRTVHLLPGLDPLVAVEHREGQAFNQDRL